MAPTLRYTDENMRQAISAVRNETMSARCAARTYNVPKSTLLDKVHQRTQEERKMGRNPYLSKSLEEQLVNWIKTQGKRGLPPKKTDVFNSVQQIVKKNELKTPFIDGKPGATWFKSFLKRNPTVVVRTPERVSKARAGVQEHVIRDWFQKLSSYLEELNVQDIFNDPSRVFNADETNMQLCPDTGKVLSIRGWKNVYELSPGPEKSTLTFLGTFSASGEIVTLAIIYPYIRIPRDIVQSVPDSWYVGSSESGWMKTETFYEWVANGFIPWLNSNNIVRPVILFVDGHRTHTSIQVSELCEENDIILYLLPPNTTHILQPADVGPFKPLKSYWRTEVHEFQRLNPNQTVTRKDVAPLLQKVLARIPRSAITNGFLATGLCPLDENRPDYSKLLDVSVVQLPGQQQPSEDVGAYSLTCEDYKTSLKVIERELRIDTIRTLNENECQSPLLQDLWNNVKSKCKNVRVPEVALEIELSGSDDTVMIFPNEDIPNNNADIEPLQRQNAMLTPCLSPVTSEYNKETENPLVESQNQAISVSFLPDLASDNSNDHSNYCQPQPQLNQPSTSGENLKTFQNQKFFPGEIKYKKRKAPAEKLPSCTKAKYYKDYYDKKENEKKGSQKRSKVMKTNDDDWVCGYCKASFYQEKKEKRKVRWIECDKCKGTSHVKCIPRSHVQLFILDESDDEPEYSCEKCFSIDLDSSFSE